MTRIWTAAFAAAGALVVTTTASAVTVTSTVTGSLSKTEETCLQGLTVSVSDGENCMYDGGPSADALLVPGGEVTGPYNHITFYDSVATPAAFQTTPSGSGRIMYAPVEGDAKIQQAIAGSISVNDMGNGFGADDQISFILTLRSPGAGSVVRLMGGATVADRYVSMTQVMGAEAVDSAAANGFGGRDYIIGTEGFPTLLTFSQVGSCLGDPFTSADCGHSFAGPGSLDPDFWNGSTTAGLGNLENNLGAKTSGSVVNLACIDGASPTTGAESNDCRDSQVSYSSWLIGPCLAPGGCTLNAGTAGAVRGSAEDAGWDQLVLRVSTNGSGQVVSAAGFNVDEYRVFFATRCGDNTTGSGAYNPICNSWTTGYFTLAASSLTDTDGDGVYDPNDNCSGTANPTQVDTNNDGIGNLCDADINNTGLVTTADFNLLRSVLNQACPGLSGGGGTGLNTTPCNADFNASGLVTTADFNILRARLNTAPGPSGRD